MLEFGGGGCGEVTLGSHDRGLHVLDGLFYRFHKRHNGSMADWLAGRERLWLEVVSWGSLLGAKWFLLSRNRPDEAWLTIYHSMTIILTTVQIGQL